MLARAAPSNSAGGANASRIFPLSGSIPEQWAMGAGNMADASIELTDYDPIWQILFYEQQSHLAVILASWLAGEIEHIGSTSVPGLRSKPIVDILAPVSPHHGQQAVSNVAAEILIIDVIKLSRDRQRTRRER